LTPDDNNESRIAQNILLFCRTLRKAGLPIGPGQVTEAIIAVATTGIRRRDDFYYALRSVLVTDSSQFRLFDQAFHIFFRNPRLLERMMSLLLPTLEQDAATPGDEQTMRRLMEAMASPTDASDDSIAVEVDRSGSASRREVLRHKDFEQMSIDERAAAKQLLHEEFDLLRDVPTRRFRTSPRGARYDLRKSIALMLRNNGQIIQLARRKRRRRPPRLVVICDISGSMSGYSRMFLHLAHTLRMRQNAVHGFVFGTRLTNISRWLANRDVDTALQRISDEVKDWDGGTRIADCLARFNLEWGRRVLGGNTVVVLLSDGLERDSKASLSFQMQRLKNCCDKLIWMNPMLRYAQFEPRAAGIRAMLPYVDHFVPAHNVDSILALGQTLFSGDRGMERAA
jgi:uncharacterized protein with von Willebrand factor type A (vWA) domain